MRADPNLKKQPQGDGSVSLIENSVPIVSIEIKVEMHITCDLHTMYLFSSSRSTSYLR